MWNQSWQPVVRSANRSLALIVMGSVVVLAISITAAIIHFGWIRNIYGEASDAAYPAMLPALLLLGSALSLLVSVRKHPHKGIVIAYFRRFGGDGAIAVRNQWFEKVLVEATRGFAIPVTLRDASIPGPQSFLAGVSAVSWVIAVPLGISLAILMMSLIVGWELEISGAVWFAVIVAAVFATRALGVFLRGWIGESILRRGAADGVGRLKKLRKERHTRFDIMVLWSAADRWQSNVEAILQESDFAIVDTVDTTKNIAWESSAAVRILGSESVLFLTNSQQHDAIERRKSWDPALEGELLAMSVPKEIASARISTTEQHVFAQALRKWISSSLPVSASDQDDIRSDYQVARRKAINVATAIYATVLALVGLLLLDPQATGAAELLFIVAVPVLTAFAVSKYVYRNAQFQFLPGRAMLRGGTIAGLTLMLAVPIRKVSVDWLQPGTSTLEQTPWLRLAIFLVLTSLAAIFVGALAGLLIEFLVFGKSKWRGRSG